MRYTLVRCMLLRYMHMNYISLRRMPMRYMSMRCTPVRYMPVGCISVRCTPVRYTPMRCTPMRYNSSVWMDAQHQLPRTFSRNEIPESHAHPTIDPGHEVSRPRQLHIRGSRHL